MVTWSSCFHLPASIHRGGLVQFLIPKAQGGQVDNRAVPPSPATYSAKT